jgi:hypothetical protein
MAVRFGELDKRQLELLRREIIEMLAANFAYPPFFDFRANRMIMRPIDRAKRTEIEKYVQSVNFGPLDRTEVSSPDVRRFISRVFHHYVEVNAMFSRPRYKRFLPGMRAHASRTATQVQRSLLSHLERNAPSFGAPRQQPSWSGAATKASAEDDETEHNTRVLEATMLRRAGDAPGPYVPVKERRAPAAAAAAAPPQAQFQSSGAMPSPPTGRGSPASPPAAVREAAPNLPSGTVPGTGGKGRGRDIPSDLMELYGEYLSDMQPEAYASGNTVAPPPSGARSGNGYQALGGPGVPPSYLPGSQPTDKFTEDARSDKLIFWQLRYQLEAYIRRATRSYGVQADSGEPFVVLDSLRRSGFVDESDLRIAEGIFALTDKVTASGVANLEDYRQAFMLYLLYHRSHMGG